MNFPIWDPPGLGGAMVIAGIAIVHVFIAHFAVGAGIFNVITERRAIRRNDAVLLQFVRDHSVFLVYLAFVAGAVTGVGIWFSIGVVAPEGTFFLIRLFVWAWAIEWVFFLVELVSGYIYYYSWDRLSAKQHIIVGWIYAISAFFSLVVINGILCFMITPGDWPLTGSIWDAWMNPSFWPSLLLRTVSALSLAGIFVAIVVSRSTRIAKQDQSRIVAWGARFMIPLAAMPLFGFWFFETIPSASRDLATGGAIVMSMIFAFGILLSFLVGAYAYFGLLRRSRDINFETALLMAAIAFFATASMEFVREGIRKPYLLTGIMYSNGILVSDVPRLNEEGILANSRWVTPDTVRFSGSIAVGEAIYRIECLRCHQYKGYNAMEPLIRDWNRPLIENGLDHLDRLRPFMPPFIGSEAEKAALADYLMTFTRDPDRTSASPADSNSPGAE
jgi:mono/diheme cytochrome c family protein